MKKICFVLSLMLVLVGLLSPVPALAAEEEHEHVHPDSEQATYYMTEQEALAYLESLQTRVSTMRTPTCCNGYPRLAWRFEYNIHILDAVIRGRCNAVWNFGTQYCTTCGSVWQNTVKYQTLPGCGSIHP